MSGLPIGVAGARVSAMLLVIDNFDSFTFNLVHYLFVAGAEPHVLRANDPALASINPSDFDGLLVSPGPNGPEQAGHSLPVLTRFLGQRPVLGVCLGHQCLVHALGGQIVRASLPRHGKASPIVHNGRDLFAGLPSPLAVGRYHSLVANPTTMPAALEITAHALDDGAVMAVAHRSVAAWGVQFHPESILTDHGQAMINAFVARTRG